MFKKTTLIMALGSIIPGFTAAAYACGGCGDGGSACAAGDGCGAMAVAPTTAAAKSTTIAQSPRRMYRSYSYTPSYGGYRSYRGYGFSSGVRGAGSKVLGNYGR